MSNETRYTEGVGRRKSAIARVRITPAVKAIFLVADKPSDEYFKGEQLSKMIREPLKTSGLTQKFNISARVKGGGVHSQAEAVRLGLARALNNFDHEARGPLKKAGLLTRNARIKERRKFGLKKARKAPQWSKR